MITECPNCVAGWGIEEIDLQRCYGCGYPDNDEDYYEDEKEREEEEKLERAAMCTCGAWVLTKNGSVDHVSDCICGAE